MLPVARRWTLVAGAGVVGLLAVGAFVAHFAFGGDPAGWRELRQAFSTTYTTPASYTQVVQSGPEGGRERREYQVWQSGRRRKVVQTFPKALAGYTVVQEGHVQICYDAAFPLVLRHPAHRDFPGEGDLGGWHLLRRRPRLTLDQGRLPDGRTARRLTISSGERPRVRLWLAPQSDFILRQERYAADGSLLDVTENRNLVRAPSGLAASLRPAPPAGAAETKDAGRWRLEYFTFALRRAAPYPFLAPAQPLDGWRLVASWPMEAAGTKVVAFRFLRRGAGFTLYEFPAGAAGALKPEMDRRPAGVSRVRFYRITRDGLVVVAVGRLAPAEARDLFASLQKISPLPGR